LLVGVDVGDLVGLLVGVDVGGLVGLLVGAGVGDLVGLLVGVDVGGLVGLLVGGGVGDLVGGTVGAFDGLGVGSAAPAIDKSTWIQNVMIEPVIKGELSGSKSIAALSPTQQLSWTPCIEHRHAANT
jgi:hypothetical protein